MKLFEDGIFWEICHLFRAGFYMYRNILIVFLITLLGDLNRLCYWLSGKDPPADQLP